MAAVLDIAGKPSLGKRRRVVLPIVNSIDAAVIATDLEGKVVFWNSVAEKLYGWSWQEAVGRRITDLVVPPNGQPDAAKIMKRLQDGKSWTGEFKLRRRDGTDFLATVTDEPMQDNDGNLVGIIGISRPKESRRPANDKRSA